MKRLPLFWLSLSFLAGIALAAVLPFDLPIWKLLCVGSLILALGEWMFARRKWQRYSLIKGLTLPTLLIFSCFFAGVWRYDSARVNLSANQLAHFNEAGSVQIEGILINDPYRSEGSIRLVVQAEGATLSSGEILPVKGKLLVLTRPGDYQYGQQLVIRGVLQTPPEDEVFSYKAYLARQGIVSLVEFPQVQTLGEVKGHWFMKQVYHLRRLAYERIQIFYSQPEAALLSGILLGVETDIPYDLEQAYQQTGTAHIIAISGFNMALLASLCLRLFQRRFSMWWAGLLAILTIICYTLLVGAAPAVVRAAVMSSLAMTGSLIGRRQAGVFTLFLTAAVMCAFNPLLLWDAGFQLSVMATLGLILYADRMLDWFRHWAGHWLSEAHVEKIAGPVGEYFLFTLAAQAAILPVLLFHFEQLSLTSLLANPLILPVQPFIMIAGGLALLVGLVLPGVGQLLSYGVWLLLAYTNQVVTWLAGLSPGTLNFGQVSLPVVILLYTLLFFFTLRGPGQHWLQPLRRPVFLSVILFALVGLCWNVALHLPDGRLHLFLPAKPPEGIIFLQSPGGKQILVNAGTKPNTLSSQLSRRMSIFDRQLDAALVLKSKQAYYQAFDVLLERFPTEQFIWAAEPAETFAAHQLQQQLFEQDSQIAYVEVGQVLDCSDGVTLTILDQNEDSAQVLLTYENLRVLLTDGSLSSELQEELVQVDLVLVYAEVKEPRDWLPLQPEAVIYLQGDPGLDPYGITLQQQGWLELESDGDSLWITGEG